MSRVNFLLFMLVSLAVLQSLSSKTSVSANIIEPPQYLKCKNLAGGGWKLVRHIGPGNRWFQNRDKLQGPTNEINRDFASAPQLNYNSAQQWSVKWPFSAQNTEYLFADVDCGKWMITHYHDIYGIPPNFYTNKPRYIHNNSITLKARCTNWFLRSGNVNDPSISLTGWTQDPMYIEGYATQANANQFIGNGKNVWVRENTLYNANNIKSCPITESPTTHSPSRSPTILTTSSPTFGPIAKCALTIPFDIVFVVDGSTSVHPSDFTQQLKFIGKITRKLALNTRVSMIEFAIQPNVIFGLDDAVNNDLYDVANKIESVKQSTPPPNAVGTTYTKDALLAAIDMYKQSQQLNRKRLVFLLTDGEPTMSASQNPCADASVRDAFDAENIRVFEVAIRLPVTTASLQCLPVNNQTDIFGANHFTPNEFHAVTKDFLSIVCPKSPLRRLLSAQK